MRAWEAALGLVMSILVTCACGQAPVIDSFHGNGVLSCANLKPGSTCAIEWASSPAGPWTNTWDSLAAVTVGSNGTVTVGVPMFYRVRGTLPDYLVIDLSAGPSASNYPVSYLANVPVGGWTDEYKTTKLVLRLLSGSTFIMGSPAGELGRYGNETQHQVTLTRGFYMGVFEVTQKQWERVMGTWPSYFNNVGYRDTRAVEQVSYNAIRGSSAGAGWPETSGVDANSFMGRLRARTGQAFDLPTESQWEYAGRAGTTTALNSGHNLTNTSSDAHMDEVGRYLYNGGLEYSSGGDASVGTAMVGSYLANQWGLYDIHGNVWEWCLDWYGTYPETVSDPKGPVSGATRVRRGGGWSYNAAECRVAYRGNIVPSGTYRHTGFRAVLPAGQ